MQKLKYLLGATAIALSSCATLPSNPHKYQILIHTPSQAGSGIYMNDRYIATNHHVIEAGVITKITKADGSKIDYERFLTSSKLDLAVIVLPCRDNGIEPVVANSPTLGMNVSLYGPQTLIPRDTRITAIVDNLNIYASHPKPLSPFSYGLGIDKQIPQGFSGGPVIDLASDTVIGMTQGNVEMSSERGPTGYFYAIDQVIKESIQLMNDANIDYQCD